MLRTSSIAILIAILHCPGASASWVNRIGSERAMCEAPFLKAKPHLASSIRTLKPSVLEIECGSDHQGSAVLVATPSRQVVASARHVVSTYEFKDGKYRMKQVADPRACRFRVTGSRQWTRAHRTIAPNAAHNIHELNMHGHRDWIVFPLEREIPDAQPAEIASEDEIAVGAPLIATGAIGWTGKTIARCLWASVCSIREIRRDHPEPHFKWTDCSNVSGMSGGPSFITSADGRLKVAGILSGSMIERPDGSPYHKDLMSTSWIALNGAFLNAVHSVEQQIRPSAFTNNSVLGMRLATITDELRRQYKLDANVQGLVVTWVRPESAAEKQGITPGNVVLFIGGAPVASLSDAERITQQLVRSGKRTTTLAIVQPSVDIQAIELAVE